MASHAVFLVKCIWYVSNFHLIRIVLPTEGRIIITKPMLVGFIEAFNEWIPTATDNSRIYHLLNLVWKIIQWELLVDNILLFFANNNNRLYTEQLLAVESI